MRLAIYLGIIGVLLLVMTFFFPIWSFTAHNTKDPTITFSEKYLLLLGEGINYKDTFYVPYDNAFKGDNPNIWNVIQTTQYLLIISIIMGIISIVITRFSLSFSKLKTRPIIPVLLMFITSLLLFFTAIYLSDQFTNAFYQDKGYFSISTFMGSSIGEMNFFMYNIEWGPGISWFLIIIAFILLLIDTIMLYSRYLKVISK